MRRVLPGIALLVLAGAILVAGRDGDPLPPETTVDLVLVEKGKRSLSVLADGELIRTYTIALGENPVGHKRQEGDSRTPEGRYVIDYRNPHSSYHLSLHISYPTEDDKARAADRGVSPGGDIFIHGLPPRFKWVGGMHVNADWTDGCIAVTNDEIEELWRVVPNGTPIEIKP